MINTIKYNNKDIRFSNQGNGQVVVLLHGFLESLDIWESFANKLAEKYKVICIDLPGHGKSAIQSQDQSIELMADIVKIVLEHLQITHCIIAGHSMGGYVAMAFLDKYPEMLRGVSLINSTPFADNETKKAARELMIDDINNSGFVKVCKNHVPKTFASDNASKYIQQIGFGKIIALNTPVEGAISAINAMKNRKDYQETLKNTDIPFLYIAGEKDNFIPASTLNHIKFPRNTTIIKCKKSGHQSYIEQEDKVLQAFYEFII